MTDHEEHALLKANIKAEMKNIYDETIDSMEDILRCTDIHVMRSHQESIKTILNQFINELDTCTAYNHSRSVLKNFIIVFSNMDFDEFRHA